VKLKVVACEIEGEIWSTWEDVVEAAEGEEILKRKNKAKKRKG